MLPLRTIRLLLILTLELITQISELYGQDGFTTGTPKIAYWTTGRNTQIVIVIHGGPGAAHDYLIPEWNTLSEIARIIYYDQRGTGKSEKSSCYSWTEHVGDLKRLIAQTSNGKKVILAGTSWGATLALLYGYTYPGDVKALILSGTFNWAGQGLPQKDCDEYRLFPLKRIKDTGHLKSLTLIDSNGDIVQTSKTVEVNNVSHSMTNQSMASAPTLTDLSKIMVPTLIVKGGGSCKTVVPKEGADLYVPVISNCNVEVIAGSCHDPWITHTKQFFNICINFIKSLR